MLTQDTLNKARQISVYAQEFCVNNGVRGIKPKHLLPYLVEKGVFNQIDTRNGRDLREVLRKVDDANQLGELIPQASVERKSKNRFWFFNPI